VFILDHYTTSPFFSFTTPAPTEIYTLSLHDALPIYDWLYALRRLFRDGSRPQVVVLGVGVNAFLSNAVRQDYAPLMLFDLQDAYDVASELKFDRTATSNLLLDHSSAFWDRSEEHTSELQSRGHVVCRLLL